MLMAHASEVLGANKLVESSTSDLEWGTPLGIAIFLIGATLAFFLFSLAVKNFTEIEAKTSKNKK